MDYIIDKKDKFKVLLTQPIWDIEDQFGRYSKGSGNNIFSYGLASIATLAEKEGFNVNICDTQVRNLSFNDFEQFLTAGQYKIIGFPCYTASVNRVKETASLCRRILPGAVIVIGGIHPTLLPKETLLELKDADMVVVGEGEYTFLNILRYFKHGEPKLSEIPNIAYRIDGDIKINHISGTISNLDDLPMPAYHLFPMKLYRPQFTIAKRLPTFGIFASRGCPYRCAFCSSNVIHGNKLRYRSIPKVITEIKYLQKTYGARGITFQDSAFTSNRRWVKEFCHNVIKEKLNLHFMCYSRVDAVNEELLLLMKKAGFWGIGFGLESGNQKSLDLLQKGTTVGQNIMAVKIAQKLGYYVQASYILALPGEDREDVYNTLNFAKETGTEIAFFNRPVPFPGTKLFEICKLQGGLKDNIIWDDYNMLLVDKLVYTNPNFSPKEIKDILNYAIYSYYLNPRVIRKNLKHISSIDDIKKYFYGFLGVFGKKW